MARVARKPTRRQLRQTRPLFELPKPEPAVKPVAPQKVPCASCFVRYAPDTLVDHICRQCRMSDDEFDAMLRQLELTPERANPFLAGDGGRRNGLAPARNAKPGTEPVPAGDDSDIDLPPGDPMLALIESWPLLWPLLSADGTACGRCGAPAVNVVRKRWPSEGWYRVCSICANRGTHRPAGAGADAVGL